jgi:hypothetical protein
MTRSTPLIKLLVVLAIWPDEALNQPDPQLVPTSGPSAED